MLAADLRIHVQQLPVAVAVDDVQAPIVLIVGIVGDQEMVARDRVRIAERILVRPAHLVLRPRVGRDVRDRRRIERPLGPVDQRDRAVVVAVRDERADQLLRAGHLARLAVAVGRVVAEDQLRVRAVGADGPERVAEVGALVQVLRAGPQDAAVAHHRRLPLAQVGMGKTPQVRAVGVHAVQHVGLRPPAEEADLAPRGDEGQAAVGQGHRVEIVERPVGQLPQAGAVGCHRVHVPVRRPTVHLRLVGPVGEVDGPGVEVRHRLAHDALAAVEELLDAGAVRPEPVLLVAGNVQHIDAAARFENPVQVLAVVVRFQERMPLGEQDALQRRQGGIAEEELPLGQPRRQVERLRSPAPRRPCRRKSAAWARSAATSSPCRASRSISSSNSTSTRSSGASRAMRPQYGAPPGTAGRSTSSGDR